jgi:orotidine-5'-phosphate decarboxylase
MMRAAREAIDTCDNPPILIAVTVLTSMESNDLLEIGVTDSVEAQVLKLARLTQDAGLDGVVCSAQEASLLRKDMGHDFCLVTPGIRLADSKIDDQRRIVTPETAIANGANYIVIGRPITQSKEPKAILGRLRQLL